VNSFFSLYDLSVCLPDLKKLHLVSGLLVKTYQTPSCWSPPLLFSRKKSFGFSIRVICDQESNLTCILLFCQKEGLREPLNFKDEKTVAEVCVEEPSGQLHETADNNIEYSCVMSEFWWSSHEIFLGSFLFAYVDHAAGWYNVTFLRLCWYKINAFRQVVWKHCCPFILALMLNGIFLLNSL